jgi:hypothetical protein
MKQTAKRMMIMIAGPYRSGTGDEPEKMAGNLRALEEHALPIWRAGHVPMIGEWVALPLMGVAGSKRVGDDVYEEIAYPVAGRLIERCDAVLRVSGASKGADEDVRIAKERGIPVFTSAGEIPIYAKAA